MKLTKIPFANKILPPAASWIIKSIGKSIRLKVIGEDKIQNENKKLYAFFHGRQFGLVWYMRRKNIALLSSTSRDGEVQARILKMFGYEITRGSYKKGGGCGIIGLRKKVLGGFDIGLAVDGPSGPCYSVKDGIIFIAKKLNLSIVPITFSSFPSYTFKNAWDKYLLPYPFSKTVIIFGKPYKPNGEIENEKIILSQILISLTKEADRMVKC